MQDTLACTMACSKIAVLKFVDNMQDSRRDEQAGGLVQACCSSILQLSSAQDLVAALTHFHSYATCLPHFHRRLLKRLASCLPAAALREPGLCQPLSADMMAALLQCTALVRGSACSPVQPVQISVLSGITQM